MKKVYIAIITVLISLTACLREYSYYVVYSYKNETSCDLTISQFSPVYRDKEWRKGLTDTFTILQGDTHELSYYNSAGYSNPLGLSANLGVMDSTIISNGIKQVVHRYGNKDFLYLKESYTLVSLKKSYRKYEYVFTDDFFESGEPLEP